MTNKAESGEVLDRIDFLYPVKTLIRIHNVAQYDADILVCIKVEFSCDARLRLIDVEPLKIAGDNGLTRILALYKHMPIAKSK